MIREEPRTGRVADLEFAFWECWESDDNVPEAPQRHWFRSDTGLEAPTYDHMLQKLYRRALGLPDLQPPSIRSAASEWERRVGQTVRVDGKDVVIQVIEYYNEEHGGAPVSVKVVGPDGLVTSSYQEMLEKLGVAEPQSAVGTQRSAKTETQLSAVSSQLSAKTKTEPFSPPLADQLSANGEAALAISQDGKLVAHERNAAVSNGDSEVEMLPSTVIPAAANRPSAKADGKNRVVDISRDDSSEADPPEADFSALDARDMEEATRRGKEFETRHPWLWDEDRYASVGEPINSMHLVWWGEFIKAVYPELAAAALDPAKYQAYVENYDHDRPIPLNTDREDDDDRQVGADAPRCQYIKADGEQCDCPALKRKRLCYFHSKTADGRKRKKNASADPQLARSLDLELPVLEDDRAIQMAVTNICRQLARESIEPKRASTLLYGLQVAAVAVRRTAQKGNRIIF